MTKEMKRPTSNITKGSIKSSLSKVVEFYTNSHKQAYKCIQERDEYINHLESKVNWLNNLLDERNDEVLEKVKKMNEALPVVPECVAEWYEEHKDDLDYSIYIFCTDFYKNTGCPGKELTKFENWFDNYSNQPIETLIRMKDGYTIEKPQLFRVCLLDGRHTLTRRDPRKTLPFNYTFLWSYSSELKEMREINKEVDLFTEQEIKSIDERYWQFAVPVEGEE